MELKQFIAKAMFAGDLGLTAVGLGMGMANADPPTPPPVPAPPGVPAAPGAPDEHWCPLGELYVCRGESVPGAPDAGGGPAVPGM
jgi:hypothetical protein